MEIKILAFGITRDIIGSRDLELSVEEETTVGGLKQALLKQFPAFEELRSLSIAVNSEYANDELEIQMNDEIVLIPPVSGG